MHSNLILYIPDSEAKRKTVIENKPEAFEVKCCNLPIDKKEEFLWRELIQNEVFLNHYLLEQMDKDQRYEETEHKIVLFSKEILRNFEAKLHSVFNHESNSNEARYIGLTMLEIYELQHYFYRLMKKEDMKIVQFATNYSDKLIEILGVGSLHKINVFVEEYIFFKLIKG